MDRNFDYIIRLYRRIVSLSARRAWIEIETRPSVSQTVESLSARRAWIEIVAWLDYSEELLVALRKESVDRNLIDEIQLEFNSRRSPQGERG